MQSPEAGARRRSCCTRVDRTNTGPSVLGFVRHGGLGGFAHEVACEAHRSLEHSAEFESFTSLQFVRAQTQENDTAEPLGRHHSQQTPRFAFESEQQSDSLANPDPTGTPPDSTRGSRSVIVRLRPCCSTCRSLLVVERSCRELTLWYVQYGGRPAQNTRAADASAPPNESRQLLFNSPSSPPWLTWWRGWPYCGTRFGTHRSHIRHRRRTSAVRGFSRLS